MIRVGRIAVLLTVTVAASEVVAKPRVIQAVRGAWQHCCTPCTKAAAEQTRGNAATEKTQPDWFDCHGHQRANSLSPGLHGRGHRSGGNRGPRSGR